MIQDEYEQLLAERGTIQHLLKGISQDEVLTRSSFVSRLEAVEDRIAAIAPPASQPAQARLTFRGRPVVGSYGVFADFGLKATSDFVEAVTAMAAALTAPLGSSGPIPNRDQNRLVITSTAVGSFGFELEEHREDLGVQLSLGLEVETPVAQALAQVQEILGSTLRTDDELADAISGIDRRAMGTVRTFLETLTMSEATCSLAVGEKVMSFRDVSEVRRSLERLGQDNLHEEQQSFEGAFQGVLPKLRTFEFRLMDGDTVLTGKVGPAIGDPGDLNQRLRQNARIKVVAVRVGSGRPRFVLNEQPEWLEQ